MYAGTRLLSSLAFGQRADFETCCTMSQTEVKAPTDFETNSVWHTEKVSTQ